MGTLPSSTEIRNLLIAGTERYGRTALPKVRRRSGRERSASQSVYEACHAAFIVDSDLELQLDGILTLAQSEADLLWRLLHLMWVPVCHCDYAFLEVLTNQGHGPIGEALDALARERSGDAEENHQGTPQSRRVQGLEIALQMHLAALSSWEDFKQQARYGLINVLAKASIRAMQASQELNNRTDRATRRAEFFQIVSKPMGEGGVPCHAEEDDPGSIDEVILEAVDVNPRARGAPELWRELLVTRMLSRVSSSPQRKSDYMATLEILRTEAVNATSTRVRESKLQQIEELQRWRDDPAKAHSSHGEVQSVQRTFRSMEEHIRRNAQ